ncbi:MAG TPA: CRTAC1 family protein [Saprospiraceae bacterium]|nr:CRTAC1 family protein [Saprospiraceae bacterium]
MLKFSNIKYLLPVLTIILIAGCNTKKEPEITAETDTRVLVKRALDSVDIMAISINFNMKRASFIKTQMEQEQDPVKRLAIGNAYGLELLRGGEIDGAINVYKGIQTFMTQNKIVLDSLSRRNFYSNLGIAYMRQGEIENCVQNHNHQSCFIPVGGDGIHQLQSGSRNAIAVYEQCLKEFPNDLETKYLLNIAYMTLGEFPGKVPAKYRIDPSWFSNKIKIQPFKDIAPELGINRKSLAGGTVMDDFTNDGWLDIVATSMSPDEELVFYVNNGDGTFTDQTKAYKLDGQVASLNMNQTDFNNDGWLDIYLMRGAWYSTEGDIPSTLLMNTGKGYFEDVTIKSGLTHKAASQNAAWADFNLDGWLDLVEGNESFGKYQRGIDLYINQKDGTFKHASADYGLTMNQFLKGCVATDINNDRYPDIYFSGLIDGNFLMINKIAQQQGFQRAGEEVNVRESKFSFPCFNFDFDNDGDEDIFVSGFSYEGTPALNWMKDKTGKGDPTLHPRLYQNEGNVQFKEVASEMGLNEAVNTMGCNFGDINTDGFLDFYLATGNPLYQSLVPNKMYLSIEGKRFEDVSYSGGFANIQKGHGVGFGDMDHDGDEDIYIVIGGAYDGDGFYNCMFENPNEQNNNWVVLKLSGTKANKPAIGARVALSVQENGQERKIYRNVTSGASFGGNSLALEIGLRKATSINHVMVKWPCKECPDQTFTGMEINKAYLLTEDTPAPAPIEYMKAAHKGKEGHDHQMQH